MALSFLITSLLPFATPPVPIPLLPLASGLWPRLRRLVASSFSGLEKVLCTCLWCNDRL